MPLSDGETLTLWRSANKQITINNNTTIVLNLNNYAWNFEICSRSCCNLCIMYLPTRCDVVSLRLIEPLLTQVVQLDEWIDGAGMPEPLICCDRFTLYLWQEGVGEEYPKSLPTSTMCMSSSARTDTHYRNISPCPYCSHRWNLFIHRFPIIGHNNAATPPPQTGQCLIQITIIKDCNVHHICKLG